MVTEALPGNSSQHAGSIARRLRGHHLTAVSRGADPSCLVHSQSDVTVAAESPEAGVQAHADANCPAFGPFMAAKSGLSIERHGYSVGGTREDNEESVALGRDLDSVVGGDGVAKDPVVLAQQPVVDVVAEMLQQAASNLRCR